MALLQEREESHKHYINSLMKQMAELKEALQERTQQLHHSLEKAKAKGVLPLGLDSLHKSPTQFDMKVTRLLTALWGPTERCCLGAPGWSV